MKQILKVISYRRLWAFSFEIQIVTLFIVHTWPELQQINSSICAIFHLELIHKNKLSFCLIYWSCYAKSLVHLYGLHYIMSTNNSLVSMVCRRECFFLMIDTKLSRISFLWHFFVEDCWSCDKRNWLIHVLFLVVLFWNWHIILNFSKTIYMKMLN